MTHDYPPLTGGGLALGVRELAELLADDHDVLVLSSRLSDHFADDRRRLRAAGAPRTAPGRATLPRLFRALRRADLLLAHWTFSVRPLATISLLLGPLLGIPTVCVIHTAPQHCEYNRLRRLPSWLRAGLLRAVRAAMVRCAAVVALCPSHRRALDGAGFSVTHVLPLMLSREPADASARRKLRHEPVVGFAGELSRLKGADAIPSLLAALTPAFGFAIAGAGPLAGTLTRAVGRLSSEQRARVELMGWIDPLRMRGFYAGIDFLLVLSRTEAQCRVVLEAMMSGVVVVAVATTGTVDLITDGVTGVLVPGDDPASCGDRLVQLAANPARVAAIRGRAVEFAAELLRESRRAWRELFADLLDDAPPAIRPPLRLA